MANFKKNVKSIPFYTIAFFVPVILLLFAHMLYQFGYGTSIIGMLAPSIIFFNGLSSACFFYYIRHTAYTSGMCFSWQLVLSFAYGLCSYGILQESSVYALCFYAILPISFLFFEQMLSGKRYFPYLCFGTLLLIAHPVCAFPIILIFVIVTFIEAGITYTFSLGNLLHRLSCILLTVLLAAFRIVPYFDSIKDCFYYSGFSINYDVPVLLSRLLPGSIPSIAFNRPNGIDIYFGLFFVFLTILFFFCKEISKRKRILYGVLAGLLLASFEFSTLTYLFQFGTEPGGFSIVYSILFVFWCLKLASEALAHSKELSKRAVFTAFGILLFGILVCFLCCFHNFVQAAFPVMALALICMLFFFYKDNYAPSKKYAKICLFSFILLEFLGNALLGTNLEALPATRSTSVYYIWDYMKQDAASLTEAEAEQTEQMEDVKIKENPLKEVEEKQADSQQDTEAYHEFMSSHINSELLDLLTSLIDSVSLEASEEEIYCGTTLPNQMELLNGLCKKAGSSEDLFVPVTATAKFTQSNSYTLTSLTDTLYHFSPAQQDYPTDCYVPFSISAKETLTENLYVYYDLSGYLYEFTPEDSLEGYIDVPANKDISYNFELSTYTINPEVYEKLPELINTYTEKREDSYQQSLLYSTYIGVGISCIGLLIMMTLYFNSDKEKVYKVLLSWKNAISCWKFPSKLAAHEKKNRIYYLSFFIPCLLFITSMIITNCTPFGDYSFFDEDGIALTLPTFMDLYYSLQDGNTYLSMNGGFGNSIYANIPLVSLFSFYKLLTPEQIAPFLLFGVAICLGFCGFSMVYYMTHRLHGQRAKKNDYRLLVPAMVYALNAYMLSMHNYTGWFFTLLAFPLLITAMDYLMYKKRTLPYVLLLTYCIITNLYLALYICIFLVIYFFTCRFTGFKDFMKKGCRFALCSILAAGNSFFIIANTLLSSQDLAYQENDAILPTFGLHTSFLEQWKKHMIFPSTLSVTSDNGVLNIYCGILTLVLVLIYFVGKRATLKEKLRKLLPILFLYVSFNEQVLSYIWNGLHYQTKVPNRFVFLLLFLIAELSYDGIRELRRLSAKKYSIITLTLLAFFLICQFCSSGNTTLSWVTTCVLLIGYGVLYFAFKKKKQELYAKLLVFFLIFELGANMLYTNCRFSLSSILYYGDYAKVGDYLNTELENKYGYFRVSFPSTPLCNTGQMFHTGSTSLFHSFVTLHQNNINGMHGFYTGGNIISTNYASTPLSMSLTNNCYILLPIYATDIMEDLEYYNYLGQLGNYYVFENPNALSLGIYAPMELSQLSTEFLPAFFNDFVSLYTGSKEEIYVSEYIEYSETPLTENYFYFTDSDGNLLTFEEAAALKEEAALSSSFTPLRQLRVHLNYTSAIDGNIYLCGGEFVSLGHSSAGTSTSKEIPFPDGITEVRQDYNLFAMNDKVLTEFYEEASKNQLENIQIGNDTITGTTNYEKDGYTMLSLAYDKSWHAYIDGKEVEIEDPFDSFMIVKTPAGKHTLELKYIPYGMKVSKGISFGFGLLTFAIYTWAHFTKRRKKPSLSQ